MSRLIAYRLSSFRLLVLALCLVSNGVQADSPTKSRIAKVFQSLEKEAADIATLTSKGEKTSDEATTLEPERGMKLATFGNGCFWCTEAVFEELHGVRRVVSGYSGGRVDNPTYKQVCTGRTGHAEVIHLEYDPKVISFAKLLEVFWRTHDPTTLNRQGNDVGTQYRSAVFYHDEEQMRLAKLYKSKLNRTKAFRKPVVTEITKFKKFYPAERYHQDYFTLNGRAPYCQMMIKPKLSKFRRVFADELAKNPKNKTTAKTATPQPN